MKSTQRLGLPAFDEPSWQQVDDLFGRNPGIYRAKVKNASGDGYEPIRRLLGVDPSGLLYIGMSDGIISRFGGLRAGIYGAYRHRTYTNPAAHRIGVKMAQGFSRAFSKERLFIEIEGFRKCGGEGAPMRPYGFSLILLYEINRIRYKGCPMLVSKLSVQNFKGLRAVTIDKTYSINVVVGPNAVGKSTLLDAIRLPKILLAPRIPNEAQQALIQLGALSPHNQAIGAPGVDIAALANKPELPISMRLEFELSEEDLNNIKTETANLALLLLHSDTPQDTNESPLAFTQYLSTDEGKRALSEKLENVKTRIGSLVAGATTPLELTMSSIDKVIRGADPFSQAMITILDRRLPTHKALFSMFPAERALPQGEQPLQLGAGDAQQQLVSHMANPSTKYARLKQTIIQAIMLNPDGRKTIADEFNLIFDHLLPGKKLEGIIMNPLGLIKILVKDVDSGKVFDIDQMSSGEKGIVLTFFFIRTSMQHGGVVLLDEPELHLNAAVQANILEFLFEHCVKPLSVQVFLCTHSPEIVRDAYERDDCGLFHLRAADDLTPILKQDQHELFEVFERLGSSPADVLFTRGNIYVEGEHDSQILQAGFQRILSGLKVSSLGGRAEVEKEIGSLQAEERANRLKKVQFFVFDHDRVTTGLKSSDLVRVKQLNRYCLENYLINTDILYDIVSAHAKNTVESRGKFPSILEELALSQTTALAIKDVYASIVPESPGLRKSDVDNKSIPEAAEILADRLGSAKEVLDNFDRTSWISDFVSRVSQKKVQLETEWKSKWIETCSGKQLIQDLYRRYQISVKQVEFKKEIIKRMADAKTDDWRIINDLLTSGVN